MPFQEWTNASDETAARSHDAQNRVTSVNDNPLSYSRNGELTLDETGQSLTYDALGRRLVQDDVQHLHDGWRVIEERDTATGDVLAQTVWSATYIDAIVLRDRLFNYGAAIGVYGTSFNYPT